MKTIEEIRTEINAIDEEMAHLFEKRMNCVSQIGEIKKEKGLPFFDSSRELEVINSNVKNIKNDELKSYYVDFLNNTMRVSKEFQSGKYYVIKKNGLDDVHNIFNLHRKVLVVTDDNIPSVYYENIVKYAKEAHVYVLPHGEINKTFDNYKNILEFMTMNRFLRSDCIVAVGGGFVGDIAAFAASSYMRGVDFYFVPTTLLAQVDACIGGKTAVNFDKYKNVLGSFYNPKKVLIDVNTLKTLDKRQLHSGLVESIKMGASLDASLFELIENSTNLFDDLEEIIVKSLKVKEKIITIDPKEIHLRRVLNFGHTVGHAIESHNKFSTYLHGEAVGIGMLYFCSDDVKERLVNILKKYDLPVDHYISKEKLFTKICMDKKRVDEKINFIYVSEIGSCEIKTITLEGILNYL